MKKLIAMLLVLVLALSLAACGKTVDDEPAVMPEESVENEIPEEDVAPEQEEQPEEEQPEEEQPEEGEETVGDETPAVTDNSALDVLNNIWALYGDNEKFPVMGGNPETGIMDAPGAFDLAYSENLAYYLQMTAEQLAGVDQAATMIHMMNANTFTGGALHMVEDVDMAALAQSVRDSIQSARWMCGFPEQLLIAAVEGHMIVAFGVGDAMTPFAEKLAAAYPAAEVFFSEPIEG